MSSTSKPCEVVTTTCRPSPNGFSRVNASLEISSITSSVAGSSTAMPFSYETATRPSAVASSACWLGAAAPGAADVDAHAVARSAVPASAAAAATSRVCRFIISLSMDDLTA